jgi:hypothetical protein
MITVARMKEIWYLESDRKLITYSTSLILAFEQSTVVSCILLSANEEK